MADSLLSALLQQK